MLTFFNVVSFTIDANKSYVLETTEASIYYPSGGILVWLLIILEGFTFLGAALIFVHYRKNMLEEFTLSKAMLNPIVGTVNTIILIILWQMLYSI